MSETAGDALGKIFGEPIGIKVIDSSERGRKSVRTAWDGRVVAYNIVTFLDGRGRYPDVHEDVLAGAPIAEAFEKHGHKIERVELCGFLLDPPQALAGVLGVPGRQYPVKKVRIQIPDEPYPSVPYASIVEIYHPDAGFDGDYEAMHGMIEETRRFLSLEFW